MAHSSVSVERLPVVGNPLPSIVSIALLTASIGGLLARRLGLASHFGARFDLEVDAFLILVLALLVWQAGKVGPWVLAIGLLRYLFVLAGRLLPWLRQPLPPSRRRQAVCVQQGVTLVLCLLPPVGTLLASLLAGLATWLPAWWRSIGPPASCDGTASSSSMTTVAECSLKRRKPCAPTIHPL